MHVSFLSAPLPPFFILKHVILDEMRQITRAAKDQESKLRADLREVQRKLEAEQKYAEKVREEREDLRGFIKKQKLELECMTTKVKSLERDAGRQAENLIKFKQHWTDTMQRAVEKCTSQYVNNLDSCFPGGSYIFNCDANIQPGDAQPDGSSQESKGDTQGKMEAASVIDNDSVSVSEKN